MAAPATPPVTPGASAVGTVVVLAAGMGKRMLSERPKVLHEACGRPMLAWVLDAARELQPQRIVVVVGHGADEVKAAVAKSCGGVADVTFVVQQPQLGTGHALQVCLPALGTDPGVTVVLYGDMPCLRGSTVAQLAAARPVGGMSLLTAVPDEPRGFGRIVRDEHNRVQRIVEEKDADAAIRAIDEVNMGVYAFDGRVLVEELPKLSNANAQKEYYLTDVLAAFVRRGLPVESVELEDLEESLGVNTLQHLAEARWALQARILEGHMARGVQIEDPATAVIEHGVQIGVGTKILPFVVLRAGVTVGAHCEVGPFTHLRAGTVLRDGAEIGNFCEAKNTDLGEHAKAKHLAYLGDATIGAKANIGAGTIFANYDGKLKHKSIVGERAFIGSGTVIVAPNTIPAGATTGAGAVVAKNAPMQAGETWVGLPAKKHHKKGAG